MHPTLNRPMTSRAVSRPGTARSARTHRHSERLAATLLPVLALILALSPGLTLAQPATPLAAGDDFAGLVDIGDGRRLYLECRGSGAPTVILEAGYRSPATVWTDDLIQPDTPRTMVMAAVAGFTRVCAYERPGVAAVFDDRLSPSRSDPVPMPRTAEAVVADLHALLQAADVPGPYVLVGHSLGGLLVRLYAATYPDEVAGMVLVDAFSERLPAHLTPEQWAAFLRVNALMPPAMAGYADYETIDFGIAVETMAEAAQTNPLPPIPLFVLARGQPLGLTEEILGFSPETFEAAWRASEEDLATLSPLSRFAVAANSAHYIQLDEPELVVNAIARVVTALREPGAVSAPSAATPVATPAP